MNKKFPRGFTLIELMVVAAIISLLTSIILAALGEAKEKAQNSKFQEEFGQLVKAIEFYKSDTGYYPGGDFANGANLTTEVTLSGIETTPDVDLETVLVPKYIPKIPLPPRGTYKYIYLDSDTDTTRCSNQIYAPKGSYIVLAETSIGVFNSLSFVLIDESEDPTWRCFSI